MVEAEKPRGTPDKKIYEQIERIKDLRTIGATDSQIMRELGLSRSALSRRVTKLNTMNNKMMAVLFRGSLVSEVSYLYDRMLRTIQNCERIARNDAIEAADRINAERLKIDVSIALVKLLHEGPTVLGVQEADAIISGQQELDNKLVDISPDRDYQPDLHFAAEGQSDKQEGTGESGRAEDHTSSPEREPDTQ